MKKILLLFIACTLFLPLFARERKKPPKFEPSHNIRFGVGIVPLFFLNNKLYEKDSEYFRDYFPKNATDYVTSSLYYIRLREIESQAYNLNYSSHFKEWLGLGVTFNYVEGQYESFLVKDKSKFGSYKFDEFGLTPTAQLYFYRRKFVNLYSEVGVSISYSIYSKTEACKSITKRSVVVYPHLTLLGVTFGKRIYAYLNTICFSPQGYSSIGVGYKLRK